MNILAIDPGYARCGVALLQKIQGQKEVLLYSDCIETNKDDPFPERLGAVVSACKQLILEYKPDGIAIEKLYFANNQKTAMQVAEVRGALIALGALHDVPVAEYTPMQVKSATAGWGGADKRQIMQTVRMLIYIEKDILLDDEYDAIAIGLTHLAHHRVV